jgi:hypothetical protein
MNTSFVKDVGVFLFLVTAIVGLPRLFGHSGIDGDPTTPILAMATPYSEETSTTTDVAPASQTGLAAAAGAKTFVVSNPLGESTVSGTVRISGSSQTPLTSVTFLSDDKTLTSVTSAPYATNWDTTKEANGPHKITARTVFDDGTSADTTLWVLVWNGDSTSPDSAMVVVNPPQTISGPTPGIDSTFPNVTKGGEKYWFATFGAVHPWVKYKGTVANPFQTVVWKKLGYQILGLPTSQDSQTPYDQPWLMNTYQEPGTGNVLGFLHIENKPNDPNSTYFRGRMALAWSSDYGDTWKYLGNIVVPENPDKTGNQLGAPYIVKDGYFYMYYGEGVKRSDGSYLKGITVARAKVADVLAAAKQGKVTAWKKYYDGDWQSPGIGGPASSILYLQLEGHDHTDAAYSTFTKKYYLLTVKSSSTATTPATSKLFESEDGIHWTFVKTILSKTLPAGASAFGYNYQSIVSTDGTDNGVVGKSFYVYSAAISNTGTTNYSALRSLVTLGTATPIPPTGTSTPPTATSTPPTPTTTPPVVVTPPVLPAPYVFTRDFTSTQGTNRWRYEYKNFAGGYVPMTWNTTENRWKGNETYLLIQRGSMHPGEISDAAIRWVAPIAGSVKLTGTVRDGNDSCGDGVIARIFKNDQVLWVSAIANGNATGNAHDVQTTVSPGDSIRFVIDHGAKDNRCDSTGWNPTVTYTR